MPPLQTTWPQLDRTERYLGGVEDVAAHHALEEGNDDARQGRLGSLLVHAPGP